MMNIREYLNNILNNEGFEAWDAENENLWNMYCEEDDNIFINYCEERGIDLEACSSAGIPMVAYWVWDNEE